MVVGQTYFARMLAMYRATSDGDGVFENRNNDSADLFFPLIIYNELLTLIVKQLKHELYISYVITLYTQGLETTYQSKRQNRS